MDKTYLVGKGRRITFIYLLVLIILAILVIVKLIETYFENDIITFGNDLYTQVNGSVFTKMVGFMNPQINYYLESEEDTRIQQQLNYQINALYGLNVPIVPFVLNYDSDDYATMVENYSNVIKEKEVYENEIDPYKEDEVFNSISIIEQSKTVPYDETLLESLHDFNFLINNIYTIDKTVQVTMDDFKIDDFLSKDMTVDLTKEGPKILIYHTHAAEDFVDSREGAAEDTVVGVGDVLVRILEEKYNIEVLHHRTLYEYNKSYSLIEKPLKQILNENPSIEVCIDIHRDAIRDKNYKLLTTIDEKPTAKIMFFNGVCKIIRGGESVSLQENTPNPYIEDNMAFSLQMHLKANELYPDLTRRIYIKGHRYNMHIAPKTLLVEVGAQTNTVQEAKNAMEPLAEILYQVISE